MSEHSWEISPRPADPERQQEVDAFVQHFEAVVTNIGNVIKGKDDVIRKVLISMLAKGHVMLKDVPGTGKTMLARSIAASVECDFNRIQFTPDLLPMDITGNNIFNLRSKTFEFQPGPIFTHILLADEINRATPKTQSALLEVMAEGQVTVEGHTHVLDAPFLVLATMNPLDHQGTYVLPAAQLDRFSVQLSMGFPTPDAELDLLDAHLAEHSPVRDLQPVISKEAFLGWQRLVTRVFIVEEIKSYIVALANHIRSDSRCLAPPSPRAVLMLCRISQAHALTQGRAYVVPEDVRAMAGDVLGHRLVLSGDRSGRAFVEAALTQVGMHS